MFAIVVTLEPPGAVVNELPTPIVGLIM